MGNPKVAKSIIPTKIYAGVAAGGWTLAMLLSLGWNLHRQRVDIVEFAQGEAHAMADMDIAFRDWVIHLDGLYVPQTEETPPDSFLRAPEKNILTPSGRKLTRISHAYALRELYALRARRGAPSTHITSLHTVNPVNAPDQWERMALERIALGEREIAVVDGVGRDARLRLMRAFPMETECLQCHAQDGFKIGDIRGGISCEVPLAPRQEAGRTSRIALWLGHGLLWLLGIFGIAFSYRHLNLAVAQIRTLSGFIPICASCKKIRNDSGFWESVEGYVRARSAAEFSHSICPECADRLYKGLL